jgi:hypothetical protein
MNVPIYHFPLAGIKNTTINVAAHKSNHLLTSILLRQQSKLCHNRLHHAPSAVGRGPYSPKVHGDCVMFFQSQSKPKGMLS